MPTNAEQLVKRLLTHKVDRVFCVPGESYLDVLDALRDSGVDTVVARHEGGAAFMAEADGKLTGRPGVAFVTRGPGATNASCGVHTAQQDSTPLVLFVGQVATTMLGRDAFQEIDYQHYFGGIAKKVYQITEEDNMSDLVDEAFQIATDGRPGPVIVALPEDLQGLEGEKSTAFGVSSKASISENIDIQSFIDYVASCKAPLVLVGGSGWNETSVGQLQKFAERWNLPVGVVFRRQQLFDHDHRCYAGDCGIGINPKLRERIENSDLVVVLGSRFSEIPSQGYTLLETSNTDQKLVHVHISDCDRFPHADLTISCHPNELLDALEEVAPVGVAPRREWVETARTEYEAWTSQPTPNPGPLQMGQIIRNLRENTSNDLIITNGAGNYSGWIHRFFRYRGFGTQLAPTSGSMGYGLPAAIAAKLRYPDRTVVCFAGDGCFQMTGMEFATAVQKQANIIVVVVDNGMYGTIRMHQERRYPERVHATDIVNPDFAQMADAFGGVGFTIHTANEFLEYFHEAVALGKPAILHMHLDPEAITPTETLSKLGTA